MFRNCFKMSVKKKKKTLSPYTQFKGEVYCRHSVQPIQADSYWRAGRTNDLQGHSPALLQFIENYGPSAAMETGLVVHLFTEFCG